MISKPPTIYGLHDQGGEDVMVEEGVTGWVLFTHSIGHDPLDHSGYDYSHVADKGQGVIARLNNGYGTDNPDTSPGTIPRPEDYGKFARRCANWVKASSGCHIWIVGNESNLPAERPHGEQINPLHYALCYGMCRGQIRSVPGHEADEVLIGAVAPWNAQTVYTGNLSGSWTTYLNDILALLRPRSCDGVSLHAYSHGPDPNLIYSEAKMGEPFDDCYYNFYVYRDFMEAIPEDMRHLSVYLTEVDQDVAWANTNSGWVQNAYGEINWWNQQEGNQKILCMLLYRWQHHDKWGIEGKDGVIEDFRAAMREGYTWR